MPVLLKTKTYLWLKKIRVFRHDPLPSKISQHCEVPYDEQIYLQNGYLIGVTLRKFVTPYSQSYTDLLRVRKIATLKSSQNWQIIEPYMTRIGCDILSEYRQKQGQIQISTNEIAEMLEALYEEYSPKEEEKRLALAKKIRQNYIDFYNFNPDKELSEAENSLEYFCIILVRTLQINLGEALGLLINKCKYFKKLVIEGSKKDQYESIKKLYQQATTALPALQQLTASNTSDLHKILQGLCEGVLSENLDVIHATLNLLSFVKQEQWFLKYGYYKMLSSSYIQCFYFTLQRLSPNYELVLNQKFHTNIPQKSQLFAILINLVKTIPKTIYCKQVLNHVPLSYFYEQCYTILNPEEIDQQPINLVVSAKQLLARLMMNFTDKIPPTYMNRIVDTFKFHNNRVYWDIHQTLVLLFEILEVFMNKESNLTQKFFKIVMKYLNSIQGEIRHWIIENLRYLYQKLGKFFPLGCMLAMYSLNAIAQPTQYHLFNLIADDCFLITEQEATLALGYLNKYVQSQVHCHCFMDIIKKFIINHSKMASKWGQQTCLQTISRMDKINIPQINQSNVLNPVPPSKNKVINAIGFKRKEMLKFKEYEQNKELLEMLLNIKDKGFLIFYANSFTHAINTIEKQIGHKKKQLVNLYKNLRIRAKKNAEKIQQTANMSQIVKNIILSRSVLQQTARQEPNQFNFNYSIENSMVEEGKQKESESRLIEQQENKNDAMEEEDEQNQFISNSHEKHNENNESKVVAQEQKIDIQTILLPFTQPEGEENEVGEIKFYSNNILEQNQIIYISMIKQKYFDLLSYCTSVYTSLDGRLASIQQILKQFLAELGLNRIIQLSDVEELYMKCKVLWKNNRDLVENLLVQIAFHAFGFKKNRRIAVLCVSSLFVLLEENLREQLLENKNSLSKKRQQKPQSLISKDIKFQFKLSNRLLASSQSRNKQNIYFLCFSVLSDIFSQGFKIHLIQPLSTLVNNFQLPSSNSAAQKEDGFLSKMIGTLDPKELEEMKMLEHELEQEKNKEQQSLKNKNNEQAKFRSRKQKKRIPTEQINLQKAPADLLKKIVDNNELKTKLAARMKILEEDMNKEKKKVKKGEIQSEKSKQPGEQQKTIE